LPFAHRRATDVVSNDQRGVRRLLAHYRSLANTATRDEAHLLEGMLAETWRRDPNELASRRRAVTTRGRAQSGS
jgi:enoyl-CoA hydratase